jgi:Spy/CpxP family protein refolding chaperone
MHGYGPGMMRGYGAGMMPGYGPGMMYGYGRGMMGGEAAGWMGGYGYGGGPRVGRGYGAALSQLDLSSDQREKIALIQENVRERNWATMGRLRAETFKLRRLFTAERPDADAVAEQQKRVDALRQQLTKARVEAHNEMQAVLTPEQRDQLRGYAGWWDEGTDAGE